MVCVFAVNSKSSGWWRFPPPKKSVKFSSGRSFYCQPTPLVSKHFLKISRWVKIMKQKMIRNRFWKFHEFSPGFPEGGMLQRLFKIFDSDFFGSKKGQKKIWIETPKDLGDLRVKDLTPTTESMILHHSFCIHLENCFFIYQPFTNFRVDIQVRIFRTEVPLGYQNENQLLPPNVQFLSVYPHLTAWQSKAGFWIYPKQGGGFKYFLFLPLFGEDSHFDEYVSKGLKPPTSKRGELSKCF